MKSRKRLIQLGNKHRFFCIGSFVSEEMKSVIRTDILKQVDLLALNIDEATAVADMSTDEKLVLEIVEQSIKKLHAINPEMFISITAGRQGSWSWDGSALTHVPSIEVQAKSTAGAGDAHLSGLITGLTVGLSLLQAQELADLTAALSVESEHTINKNIDSLTLRKFVQSKEVNLCD